MKYRLGKKARKEEKLKDYLKKRLYVFSHLADELNISGQGLHYILDGRSKKPNRQTLERLAQLTETRLGFDSGGLYFEPLENGLLITDEPENPLKVFEQPYEYKIGEEENPGEYLTKINKLLIALEESGDRETLRIIYRFIYDIGAMARKSSK